VFSSDCDEFRSAAFGVFGYAEYVRLRAGGATPRLPDGVFLTGSLEVPLTAADFKNLAALLTGTPVKGETDDAVLNQILSDEHRQIDCSQFNELLLLVNKDRLERPFFEKFFGGKCAIADIADGVRRFQATAMLRYGNFIFAYRTLSKLLAPDELADELGDLLNEDCEQTQDFELRSVRLLEVFPIARADTPLVGYLSPKQLVADAEQGRLLLTVAGQIGTAATWDDLKSKVENATKPELHQPITSIVEKYRHKHPDSTLGDFHSYLSHRIPPIERRRDYVDEIQIRAARNQDVYLTWDHMDVYFATSMRKPWEFSDLYDFIAELMDRPELSDLKRNLRYFDPTQCFTSNRINKGLVEALMLKRARCTVYSVQDTDTLGKDSELAATLAQGKPVIAYVPDEPVGKRIKELEAEDPSTVQERLRFVLYADERFSSEVSPEDFALVRDFTGLVDFVHGTAFRSMPDILEVEQFKASHQAELSSICRIVAAAEKRIYDSRATTLESKHPLGIQVNLSTGVANGVLVVRSVEKCAELLRAILTRTLRLQVEYDGKDKMWCLREAVSGSIFRVVTGSAKIDNSFWNFYLRGAGTPKASI